MDRIYFILKNFKKILTVDYCLELNLEQQSTVRFFLFAKLVDFIEVKKWGILVDAGLGG